ncbi:MAG: hypothetical protein ACKVPX_05665 [Myxococcaceae bacterium]
MPLSAALVTSAAIAFGRFTAPAVEKEEPDVLALPAPGVAKLMSLGFENFAADLYFIQAVQHFGNPYNNKIHYPYLFPLLDLVSELDPEFSDPLLWGGVALQKNLGRETWINTAESTRILRKGAERFPKEWRFLLFLAYNLATFHHDFRGAAAALEKILPLPDRPEYVPGLITRMYSSAGDLGTAQAFAQAMAQENDADPALRELMSDRLTDIETERVLRQLDALGEQFHTQLGRWPVHPQELVLQGLLVALPQEPRGGEWLFDDVDKVFLSTRMHKRLQVFKFRRGSGFPEARQ